MTSPTYETYIGLGNVWTPVALKIGGTVDPGPPPPPASNNIFTPLRIDGGGYITGVSTGQEVYCRADVGGIYWWDNINAKWVQRLTGTGVSSGIRVGYDVESLTQAANGSTVYAGVGAGPGGKIYRSTDKGLNWSATAATFDINGNATLRYGTERLAVHPTNANTVLAGLRGTQGLRLSTDGGVTFPLVATAPPASVPPTPLNLGVTCVAFDPTDPTQYYAAVQGVGLCLWNGVAWSTVHSFTYGYCAALSVSPTGTVWASFIAEVSPWSGQIIRRTKAGVLTVIDAGPNTQWRNWYGIAIDPTNEARVVIMASDLNATGGNQQIQRTTNGTAAIPIWNDMSPITIDDGVVGTGWINDFPDQYTGNCKFTSDGSALWVTTGWGMFRCTDLADTQATIVFTSKGIEERVAQMAVKPAGQPLITIGWDLNIFRHPVGSLAQRPHPYKQFGSGWGLGMSPNVNSFIACVTDPHPGASLNTAAKQSGYSIDSGATWTRFASLVNGTHPSELAFGHIAVSATNVDNIVWAPGNSPVNKIYYSTNRGASWTAVTTLSEYFVGGQNFLKRDILVAHPTIEGTFYAMVYRNSDGKDSLLRSTDGGATWTLVTTTGLETFNFRFNSKLKATATHLYAMPGHSDSLDKPFFRCSLSDVTTWTRINSLRNAHDIGIGAPLNNQVNQTLYSWGRPTVAAQDGLYASADFGATWTFINQYVNGLYDFVSYINGDVEAPGKFWVGTAGNGFTEVNVGAAFVINNAAAPPATTTTVFNFEDVTLQGWAALNSQTFALTTVNPIEGTQTARGVATVAGNQAARRIGITIPSGATSCTINLKYRQNVVRDVQVFADAVPGYTFLDGGYNTAAPANVVNTHTGTLAIPAGATSIDLIVRQNAAAINDVLEFDNVILTWS